MLTNTYDVLSIVFIMVSPISLKSAIRGFPTEMVTARHTTTFRWKMYKDQVRPNAEYYFDLDYAATAILTAVSAESTGGISKDRDVLRFALVLVRPRNVAFRVRMPYKLESLN